MAYAPKDNSGSSFKNDKRREGKNDANYEGSAVVNGVEYWISTWIKNHPTDPNHDPSKKTWLSHSLRPKEQRGQQDGRQDRPASAPRTARSTPPPPPSDNDGILPEDKTW